MKNASLRVAAIISSSDARATESIRGWASGIAGADKYAFSLNLNWAIRYSAQRCERSKWVRVGARLVCIAKWQGSWGGKKEVPKCKHPNSLAALIPLINKHKLPINEFRLPRNRLACNTWTSPPNSQHTRLPSLPYTAVSSPELPDSTTTTACPPEPKATTHNNFISARGLSGLMTTPPSLPLSLFRHQTALLSP